MSVNAINGRGNANNYSSSVNMLSQVFHRNPNAVLSFSGRDGSEYTITRQDGAYVVTKDGAVQDSMTPQQVFTAAFGADTGRTILFETLSKLKRHLSEVSQNGAVDVDELVSSKWARANSNPAPTAANTGSGDWYDNSSNSGDGWEIPWGDEGDSVSLSSPARVEAPAPEPEQSGFAAVFTFSVSIQPEKIQTLYMNSLNKVDAFTLNALANLEGAVIDNGFGEGRPVTITVNMEALANRLGPEVVERLVNSLKNNPADFLCKCLIGTDLQPGDITFSAIRSNGQPVSSETMRAIFVGIWRLCNAQELNISRVVSAKIL